MDYLKTWLRYDCQLENDAILRVHLKAMRTRSALASCTQPITEAGPLVVRPKKVDYEKILREIFFSSKYDGYLFNIHRSENLVKMKWGKIRGKIDKIQDFAFRVVILCSSYNSHRSKNLVKTNGNKFEEKLCNYFVISFRFSPNKKIS